MNGKDKYSISKIYSLHNILGKIKDSTNFFLLNMLSGSADIVDEETAIKLKNEIYHQKEILEKKGYLINSEDEKIIFINTYCECSEKQKKKPMLIHFIPWFTSRPIIDIHPYTAMKDNEKIASDMVVDAFFQYLDSYITNRQKIIALSGGEPLLPEGPYKKALAKIFLKAEARSIPIRIYTNGYNLYSYFPELENKKIESIRIIFNLERSLFSKYKTKKENVFLQKVTEGINASLKKKIHTNIDIIVDHTDIDDLHFLASYAEESGWTDNKFFSAQIIVKDNFLFCDSIQTLYPYSAEAAEELYNNILKYPEILELNSPFSIAYFLLKNNHLPSPLFRTCPGGKFELAFTQDGHIFPCVAALTKPEECFGTFYPDVTIHPDVIETWDDRDVTTIKKCTRCSFQLACGGGCTIKAKETLGKYSDPNCIPVKQYIELGLSLYFEKRLISE